MTNIDLIQVIGVLITSAGVLALVVMTSFYETPLTREARLRNQDRRGNVYRLPLNWETRAASLVLLAGIGILMWSKFDLCIFLAHWLPDLSQVT